MHFLQVINSDISVLIVCNKTGGKIKGDIKKNYFFCIRNHSIGVTRNRNEILNSDHTDMKQED